MNVITDLSIYPNFSDITYSMLQCLIIDEVDHILEQNFEEDMKQIFTSLRYGIIWQFHFIYMHSASFNFPEIVLFSATQTQRVSGSVIQSIQTSQIFSIGGNAYVLSSHRLKILQILRLGKRNKDTENLFMLE